METLEMKITVPETKNSYNELISRMDTSMRGNNE